MTWQENPACTYDDDIWLGYLIEKSGVKTISVPGVEHGDITQLQFEKWVTGKSLSEGINGDGTNRSKCTRSLLLYP